jgi:hypothetical protein
VLAKAKQDAIRQSWAHLLLSTITADQELDADQDAGLTTGKQLITVGSSHAQVIVMPGKTYLKGDAAAVTDFFGSPPSEVRPLANRWIMFVPSDPSYQDVTDSVTLPSVMDQITLDAPTTTGAITSADGIPAVAITGTVPDDPADTTATLYVIPGAHPLPIELSYSELDDQFFLTFTNWGNRVTVTAPTGALPAGSLFSTPARPSGTNVQ